MKLNVIATFPEYKDGIPRVAEELIKRICNAAVVDSLSIITRRDIGYISPAVLANTKVSLFTTGRFLTPRTFFEVIKLYKEGDIFLLLAPPWDVFDPLPELYLFLYLIKYGFLPRYKWVQLVHDFIPYVYGDDTYEQKRTLKLFNSFKKRFLSVPAKYIAVSESTKKDAMRYWGLPEDKIAVIHHGSFVAPTEARADFGSKKVVMVSDIGPRKNHVRLIEAFEKVYRNNPSQDLELIIVGHVRKDVPEFETTLSDVRKRNEEIKIKICGYLTDSEILSLYEHADVFVYPSLYEGFGLPVLEAMACGCPVIASNTSSLPEVIGDAGLLIDPHNVDELAQAITTVLGDDELKKAMSRKSVAQAQKFSWEKAGEAYVTLFDNLLCKSKDRL